MSAAAKSAGSPWHRRLWVVLGVVALVAPGLADLYFAARLPPAFSVDVQTAAAMGLFASWLFGSLFVLAVTSHRGDDQPDTPGWLLHRLIVTVTAAAALAAVGWYSVSYGLDLLFADSGLVDDAADYAGIRIAFLPVFAAGLVFVRWLDCRSAPMWLFGAALMLNAGNLALNSLVVGGFAAELSLGAVGWSTSLSTLMAVLVLAVAAAIRNDATARQWLGQFKFRRLARSFAGLAGPKLVWLLAVAALPVLLWAGYLVDLATVEEALQQARDRRAVDVFDMLIGTTAAPEMALTTDWALQLADSRPPLFAHSAGIALASFSLLGALIYGYTESCRIDADDLLGRWYAATAYLFVPLTAVAVALIVFAHPVADVLTVHPDAAAATAPAIRLLGSQLPFVGLLITTATAHFVAQRPLKASAVIASTTLVVTALAVVLAKTTGFMGLWWGMAAGLTGSACFWTITFWRSHNPPADD